MPSRQEMEAAIRKACQAAHGQTKAAVRIDLEEDCGLADVLAALGEGYALDGRGELMKQTWREPCSFDTVFLEIRLDLALPLSGQPDATVAALYLALKADSLTKEE
jgi:hypothetical protein